MVKRVMRAKSIAYVPFYFITIIYQQKNSEGYFERAVLNNSMLEVGRTAEASYRIWDSVEWYKEYGFLHLYWREVNTRKYDIMLMGVDVHGDWEIEFFHSMECYVLKIINSGKLREGSNEGVDWMFPQFQAIKDTSVSFSINKMLQGCFVMVYGFKRSDAVGTSICCGYADDIVMNPTLDILSDITRGGWNF